MASPTSAVRPRRRSVSVAPQRPLRAVAAPARPRHRVPSVPVEAFRRSIAAGLRRGLADRAQATPISDVDGWLLAVVGALCAFGLVMVYSASEALGYAWFGNPSYYFERQLAYMAVGIVLLLGVARLDYHRWRDWAPGLAAAALLLLALVLLPHVSSERLGARRWLSIGPLSLQPSALATLAAIVFFARWLSARGPAVRTFLIARRYLLLVAVLLTLVLLERDLGSSMVLAASALTLLILAGGRKRHLLLIVGALGAIGWLAVRSEPYRGVRIASFRDPFSDPLNSGFQSVESLLALGSGGWHGVGLGNSIQKYQWLPEAHTDFIFAIIGEELGLIGTLAVIGAFMVLGWRGVRAARRAPDTFGALLAGGITAWIGVQAFVNMAAVTGVTPTTGITLPFISSGGSSLLATLLATGVLCNISAQGRRHAEVRRAHVDRWRGDGRPPDPRDRGGLGAAPARPHR